MTLQFFCMQVAGQYSISTVASDKIAFVDIDKQLEWKSYTKSDI